MKYRVSINWESIALGLTSKGGFWVDVHADNIDDALGLGRQMLHTHGVRRCEWSVTAMPDEMTMLDKETK